MNAINRSDKLTHSVGHRLTMPLTCFKPYDIHGKLGLQMHHRRSEHWVMVCGMAKVMNGENGMLINTNESTYISSGHKHRLENVCVVPLFMIEVQSGEYLGEDNIVRFDDNYGLA